MMTRYRFPLMAMYSLFLGPIVAIAADEPAIHELPIAAVSESKQEDVVGYSWKQNDVSLTLMRAEQIIWRFNFGTNQGKPFFDPVNLPGMGNLVWNAPPDHPWHHGIWFSWKLIDRVNYWEEDRKTGQSDGRTTWNVVSIEPAKDFSARIELELKYHPPEKPPVLLEHRVIHVTPPDSEGGYQIDWTAKFKANGQAVVLDRTPLPNEPNGKVYGGYAGLSVRLAKEAARFEITNSQQPEGQEKKKQPTRMRFKSAAVDNAGTIQGVYGGIAILDHPGNLNAPSPWYIIRDTQSPMTYFSPAVIQKSPHTLADGDSFTLRYRILVHPGRYDLQTLQRHYRRFTEASDQEKK